MKVYVLIVSVDHEGYNLPMGIFTDRDFAVKTFESADFYGDELELHEYDADSDDPYVKNLASRLKTFN